MRVLRALLLRRGASEWGVDSLKLFGRRRFGCGSVVLVVIFVVTFIFVAFVVFLKKRRAFRVERRGGGSALGTPSMYCFVEGDGVAK